MTIEYIRYDLVATQPEAFLASYAEAAKNLSAAPECLGYDMARCDEAPKSFVLRIHWLSTAAHLEGFRKGPHFPPFLAAIRAFMPEIVEMRHYAETDVTWTRAG